ncbi:HNH endonuclease family protein [Richelia intracellularis HH01]|uniref:HNH endonuclease family protein n=1 Tax=Richelia intracellularis HH01 TaxID=1165094 RepID=M1WXX4_9NOST|nr:HNH endonuclease [Richelia intracellularis]CCH66562.1 HNH endonuclease family protein [Richelia intracellularis HH01]HAE06316.1 HNH endonuclease [Richelia sp.]
MGNVLVLNASYEPLNITGWRRAAVLLIKGKAERIEYNNKLLYTGFPIPTVIRLLYYVRVPYREMPLTRRNVLHRDDHACQYCGYTGDNLTLDHVVPRSRGGGEVWENMVTACVCCNVKKGNRTPQEANMPLRKLPRKPYSSLYFEVSKHIKNGLHREWKKYVIGM